MSGPTPKQLVTISAFVRARDLDPEVYRPTSADEAAAMIERLLAEAELYECLPEEQDDRRKGSGSD